MAIIKQIMRFKGAVKNSPAGNVTPIGDAGAVHVAPRVITKPIAAPESVAKERLAICMACENRKNTQCRLFACCHKTICDTVNMALEKCPVGHWGMWIPPKL